jgi:hypothetical protein
MLVITQCLKKQLAGFCSAFNNFFFSSIRPRLIGYTSSRKVNDAVHIL